MLSLLVLCGVAALAEAGMKVQNVTVRGTAICVAERMTGVKLELKERDRFSFDDVLDETISDEQGRFELSGYDEEFFAIEPYVLMTHTCNAPVNCVRVTQFYVPAEYINGEVYDVSFVTLHVLRDDDKVIC